MTCWLTACYNVIDRGCNPMEPSRISMMDRAFQHYQEFSTAPIVCPKCKGDVPLQSPCRPSSRRTKLFVSCPKCHYSTSKIPSVVMDYFRFTAIEQSRVTVSAPNITGVYPVFSYDVEYYYVYVPSHDGTPGSIRSVPVRFCKEFNGTYDICMLYNNTMYMFGGECRC